MRAFFYHYFFLLPWKEVVSKTFTGYTYRMEIVDKPQVWKNPTDSSIQQLRQNLCHVPLILELAKRT